MSLEQSYEKCMQGQYIFVAKSISDIIKHNFKFQLHPLSSSSSFFFFYQK